MNVNKRFGVYFPFSMGSVFTIFCKVKFKFLLHKFKTDLGVSSLLAAVICGAFPDHIKRIEDKGAFH